MKPVRVMIVDDSAVIRGLLVRALSSTPEIAVSATAMHGRAALSQLRRQSVDIVVLDVEMPVLDGLATLPHLLGEFPETRVIMASAHTREGADATVRALALGAAACIAKPTAASISEAVEKLAEELVPLVLALGRSGRSGSHSSAPSIASLEEEPSGPAPEVIVIGSSTGGPNALSTVLKDLPPAVTCPILIAQHMPPTFTSILAGYLQRDSGRICREAAQGGTVRGGEIYVAPGNFHLALERTDGRLVTSLNQSPPQHFCRPSVNPLFESAARCCGRRVLAIMLTGMGDDGIEATREIVDRGGRVIAQDEASSVVWGMPGAVARAGLAHEILPLGCIAEAIAKHCTAGIVL
jgi:two-component system chemotaxis response regulator CheB